MACPANPPFPPGWTVWVKPVPKALSTWSVKLLHSTDFQESAYGTTWSTVGPSGDSVLARKDYHTWTHDAQGNLVTNVCISGVTLYQPLTDKAVFPAGTVDVPLDGPKFDVPAIVGSGLAIAGIIGLFWLGLKYASKA